MTDAPEEQTSLSADFGSKNGSGPFLTPRLMNSAVARCAADALSRSVAFLGLCGVAGPLKSYRCRAQHFAGVLYS